MNIGIKACDEDDDKWRSKNKRRERERKNVDQKNTNKENRKLSESNCHTITIQEKIVNSGLEHVFYFEHCVRLVEIFQDWRIMILTELICLGLGFTSKELSGKDVGIHPYPHDHHFHITPSPRMAAKNGMYTFRESKICSDL